MTEDWDTPVAQPLQGAGCKSCATCPLLGKVKSPLNIRPDVTATVNDTGSPVGLVRSKGRARPAR